MRAALIYLLAVAALVASEYAEEPWVEEEDVDESYDEQSEEVHSRGRREVYYEEPYEEHVRVKRHCADEPEFRVRRSAEYVRVPRQVHQYEVHEFSDDMAPSSPPYEEMLAASADHYHRVYAAPGQAPARYLNPEVSVPNVGVPVSSHPVQYVAAPNHKPVYNDVQFVAPNAQPVYNDHIKVVPPPNANLKPVFNDHVQFVAPTKPALNSPVQFVAPPKVGFNSPVQFVGPNALNVAIGAAGPVPLKQLSDGDLVGSAAGHHHKHQHGHKHGGGHQRHAKHFGEHGGKSTKGAKTTHHVDKGAKGFKTDETHRQEYDEALGKKRKHHDHAGHKGSHEEEAHGQRGAKFDEKKGHKKGHKTKGYHNKYHKDEFHKEHKFYDDYHKSGEHHRFGKFHAKHASNESGKKKAHHVNAGHDVMERGKKGYSNKGHLDADHKGYKSKDGHEEHHEHHSDHGKKGGKEGGSHWGYAKN